MRLICFWGGLEGGSDPEEKRKIIGASFIEVFDGEAARIDGAGFLAQGTLYPDVIESISVAGGSEVTIKSHHNVGGLPDDMALELVEPLRMLFKDEVRALGRELGLAGKSGWPPSFPGAGSGNSDTGRDYGRQAGDSASGRSNLSG